MQNLKPKIPILEKYTDKTEILRTHNFLCQKFAAVCRKIATSSVFLLQLLLKPMMLLLAIEKEMSRWRCPSTINNRLSLNKNNIHTNNKHMQSQQGDYSPKTMKFPDNLLMIRGSQPSF